MDTGTIVNSPLVLTILGLLWGGIIASWITALWQKRNPHHELKLKYAQEVIEAYQEYIRLVRGTKIPPRTDFDELQIAMMSHAKVVGHLYSNKEIRKLWASTIDKLSSIFDLKTKGRSQSLVENKLVEIYDDSNQAI